MSTIKRYLFEDRSFDPDWDPEDSNSFEFFEDRNPAPVEEEDEYAEEEEIEEPPAPTFSEEEVAAAQQSAFDEGKVAGIQEANAQFERMIANALTQISQSIPKAFEEHKKSQDDHEVHALNIATAVARKILPSFAEKSGVDEILNVVRQCLEPLRSEPRLIIKVHEKLREVTHEKVNKLAEEVGFDGRVVVMADENIVEGDCRIDWSEGGAERNSETLWQQIDAIIERNLTQSGHGAHVGKNKPNSEPAPHPEENA